MATKTADAFAAMILFDQASAIVSILNAMILSMLADPMADVSELRAIREMVRSYKRRVSQETTAEALEEHEDDLRSRDHE